MMNRRSLIMLVMGGAAWLASGALERGQAQNGFLDRTDVDFGMLTCGDTSGVETVMFTNTTAEPLTINGISITGANAGNFLLDLGLDGQDCLGSTLAPGAACLIRFTFVPGDVGQRTATASVAFNADGSPVTIDLSGEGSGGCSVDFTIPPGQGGQLILEFQFNQVPTSSYHITGTVEGVSIDFTSALGVSLGAALADALSAFGLDPQLADDLVGALGSPTTELLTNTTTLTRCSPDVVFIGDECDFFNWSVLQGAVRVLSTTTEYTISRFPVTVGPASSAVAAPAVSTAGLVLLVAILSAAGALGIRNRRRGDDRAESDAVAGRTR